MFFIHGLSRVNFGVGNGASSLSGMHFPKRFPIRGCMYLPRTDSSIWFWVCLKSSCMYAPSHPYPSHPPISSRCSFPDHLKFFSCLLSGHAAHCVLIWLSHKESPTGIIDAFLSFIYIHIYRWYWLLGYGREMLVIKTKLVWAAGVNGSWV